MILSLSGLFAISFYLERRISNSKIHSAVLESIILNSVNWSFVFPPMVFSMFSTGTQRMLLRWHIIGGLIAIPLCLIMVTMIIYGIIASTKFVFIYDANWLEYLCAFCSIILSIVPIAVILSLIIPVKLFKDTEYIRWNFLQQIYTRRDEAHPNYRKWKTEFKKDG